jgi:hypothetical protein
MRKLDSVVSKLAHSQSREGFRLGRKKQAYLDDRGLAVVLDHAADFIAKRLAPAEPVNDGKQTPMRGHPVFIAQHATATCWRSCFAKWHGISKRHALSEDERRHAVSVLRRWLERGLD